MCQQCYYLLDFNTHLMILHDNILFCGDICKVCTVACFDREGPFHIFCAIEYLKTGLFALFVSADL